MWKSKPAAKACFTTYTRPCCTVVSPSAKWSQKMFTKMFRFPRCEASFVTGSKEECKARIGNLIHCAWGKRIVHGIINNPIRPGNTWEFQQMCEGNVPCLWFEDRKWMCTSFALGMPTPTCSSWSETVLVRLKTLACLPVKVWNVCS